MRIVGPDQSTSVTTMRILNPASGEEIKVYLFVATLPYSRYTYVEPCLDMKEDTWLRCHVHMYDFFGGVSVRTVCDNLKTGVSVIPGREKSSSTRPMRLWATIT